MTQLENQVVLITGCSSGIGLALAREFHARGHRTLATARRPESITALAEEGMETIRLDVTDPASVRDAVAGAVQRAGRIDILVNNAGFNAVGPVAEIPLESLRRLFETNVMGAMAVTQRVVPLMAAQRSGRILNIGSIVGVVPTPFAGPYCASKAALHVLSDTLRMEVAPFGIDVIVAQPGGVRSAIADTASRDLERFRSNDSLYHPVYDQIEKRARLSQNDPMPAEQFAERVVSAVTAAEAPRTIRLGTGVGFLLKLSEMPGPDLDAVWIEEYGLNRLRKQ